MDPHPYSPRPGATGGGPLDLSAEALAVRPLAQAETLPSAWYTEPAALALEREAVFARTWQYAAHRAQLAAPGAVLRADVAGEPLLLAHGRDGRIRAFYNVCRHRGGPLVMDEAAHSGNAETGGETGGARVLQCQYHGWTYTLEGDLRGVPRFDRCELFDRRDFGLVPVELAEWQGLLFVRLEPGGPDLATVLDGIAERIAPLRLDGLRFARRVTYDVACNWKAYVDNYLEGYHIPLVHPELCRVLDVRAYVTETAPWHSLQHSPLRPGSAYDAGGDAEAAFYYFVYPNAMLNVLPGRLQTNAVRPTGPDRCEVVFDYFYADVDSPGARARIEADVAFSDAVQREDAEICAHVQRGLASRGYDRGRFSPECEEGVYHFQALLRRAYRDAAPADASAPDEPPG